MKIALVSPYDYPYPGGVTEHIAALDQHFRALGHTTRIIAASSKDEDALDDHVLKVSGAVSTVPFSGSNARITFAPAIYRRVKQLLKQEQFDVVHVHEPSVPMLSLVVLRHSHALNVGTFHAYRESNMLFQVAGQLLKRVFKRLDGRIFVSDAVREYVTQYFPGEHILIPNGIDCARFCDPHIQPIEKFDDGRPNILYVGRMDKRKGFRYLLRAFPHIKRAIPDARLIVVGAFNDKDKAPLVRYARAWKLRSVHFVGRVSREELPRYYRTATIFCAPSTGFESFGIILLEAMAAGVPVIASNITGYRSVVTDQAEGLLVPPQDENALARAAIDLLNAPERRAQMSAAGKAKAAQYDWDIIAQRVLAYYEQLIAARATARAPGNRRSARVRHLFRVPRRKKKSAPPGEENE
ncbi:MAG: glycosyltransferase family 4 protein [Chloroflexi bacterium]|nr:glycosyltransferase family 4 protein [Chloroflexota bacterium]